MPDLQFVRKGNGSDGPAQDVTVVALAPGRLVLQSPFAESAGPPGSAVARTALPGRSI